MCNNRITIAGFKMLGLILLLCGVTGCLKEDLTACPSTFTLVAEAYDRDGNSLTEAQVKDVVLYIFDKNHCFLEQIQTQLDTPVDVEYYGINELYVVAWGNLKGGNEVVPKLQANEHIDNCGIKLQETNVPSINCSPDDLFWADKTAVSVKKKPTATILSMHRKVGSMNITIRHLKEYLGVTDDDFKVIVGDTYESIDFYGQYKGNRINYQLSGSFMPDLESGVGKPKYMIPPFNLIPEKKGVSIRIYHKDQLAATVSMYNGSNPIVVRDGMFTNVLIDFKNGIYVDATVTTWGTTQVWRTF